MDINEFKKRNSVLIKLGVITFNSDKSITIDRYRNGDFLCDKKELNTPRNQLKRMGYEKTFGIGTYCKKEDESEHIRSILRVFGL